MLCQTLEQPDSLPHVRDLKVAYQEIDSALLPYGKGSIHNLLVAEVSLAKCLDESAWQNSRELMVLDGRAKHRHAL